MKINCPFKNGWFEYFKEKNKMCQTIKCANCMLFDEDTELCIDYTQSAVETVYNWSVNNTTN